MQNKMIYKNLSDQFIKRTGILLVVISVWLGIDSLGAYRAYIQAKGITYVVFATPYILGISFLLITGCLYSYYQYEIYLSIQAKRQTYLKGIIVVGTLGSIGFISLVYGLAQVATAFARVIMPSDVVKDSFPLSIEGMLNLWGIGLVAFALGFFVGALFYRFKRVTAVCVTSTPLLVFIISLLSNYLFENDGSMYLMLSMMLVVKSLVGGIGQIIYILLFWMMGYQLLVKAPIKQYAHDLI
ncbi:hypothetical protein [Cellulosilyticum sp. I15G10I2]|uniref:hypothetical protein n=1 Tax=Cellulosilyticum sp. I15G10I2 TaxID=1892843 RepID=UPI00085CA2F1|nr:hypothetical protein [Cellulosilyticum sp. I15G10I2]